MTTLQKDLKPDQNEPKATCTLNQINLKTTNFSPDIASVHTRPDKCDNGVFDAKTDKMFSVHIIVFE